MRGDVPAHIARARDTLPTALRQAMERHGSTTVALGAAAGVCHARVSRWRSEDSDKLPGLLHLERVAEGDDERAKAVVVDLLAWLGRRLGVAVVAAEPDRLGPADRMQRLTLELTDVLRTRCQDKAEMREAADALCEALAGMEAAEAEAAREVG